jgi:uncharacterized protein (DUF1499 family)
MKTRDYRRLVGAALLGFLISGCSLNSGIDATPMDLRTFERPESPNNALACLPGVCSAKADINTPVFSMDQRALMTRVRRTIANQLRTELIASDAGLNQLVFIQRSKVFGFPDTIWIQGHASASGSSVIVYSRSNYGYADFGVNKETVRLWLAEIQAALSARSN